MITFNNPIYKLLLIYAKEIYNYIRPIKKNYRFKTK